MKQHAALILVDLQNDFCPGGSLAVPKGDEVISIANKLQPMFSQVIATQDWHPANHVSFACNHSGRSVGERITIGSVQQILWPRHCVQHSAGAQFHPALNTAQLAAIFHKGVDPAIDSYSTFFDNAHLRQTGLHDYLQAHGIQHIYLLGLATDYCVKYSCLDALSLGYDVNLVVDACRGVELAVGDSAAALADMQSQGVRCVDSHSLLAGV